MFPSVSDEMGNLSRVQAIVLSHGHTDHTGGLLAALNAINPANLLPHTKRRFGQRCFALHVRA